MDVKAKEVSRMVDFSDVTKVDTLASAFKAPGRELDLLVQ